VVTIGHAGMLSALVQNGLTPALASRGITIRGVKGNSLTVAGNIDNGSLPADLFGNADANANQLLADVNAGKGGLGMLAKDPQFASDGKVERVNKDGTGRTTLASGLSGPTSVAVDDSFVYFTESGLGAGNNSSGARRVAKEGGSVQRLYNVPVDVVALNGDDLYLLVGNTDTGKTTITQTAKSGTQVKRSFNDLLIINPIMTIFDGRLYYYTQTKNAFAVASVSLNLDGRTLHVERLFNGDQIGVDRCALYISTTDQEIERVMR